jgi:hypothetical protein
VLVKKCRMVEPENEEDIVSEDYVCIKEFFQ